MFSDWLFSGAIIALIFMLTGIIQWQSKRLSKTEWREVKLMDLWMYLTILQSVTKDDAELGKKLRDLIIEGGVNKGLTKYVEELQQKRKEGKI